MNLTPAMRAHILANAIHAQRPGSVLDAQPKPVPPPRRKKRTPGGKRMEKLVLDSQSGVILRQVPQGAKWIAKGQMIRIKGSVDFFGMFLDTREMLILDAKECALVRRFPITDDHVPQHQRDELIQFGRGGAVAGLLILRLATDDLHFLPWPMLVSPPPSYQWDEIPCVGSAKRAIDWARVRTVARLAADKATFMAHQEALRK